MVAIPITVIVQISYIQIYLKVRGALYLYTTINQKKKNNLPSHKRPIYF